MKHVVHVVHHVLQVQLFCYFGRCISLKVLLNVSLNVSLKVPLAANGLQAREVWVPSIASTLLVSLRELSAMSV